MTHLKRWSTLIVMGCLLGAPVARPAHAEEQLQVPQLSAKARVEQRVGITDLSVDYSSPSVKGRKIWGDLVPMGKAWRAGANASTTLTSSHDFKLGATTVKAGSYAIFMVPGEKTWTVVLNADTQSGGNHNPAKDVAKLDVAPSTLGESRERLTYIFSDATEDRVNLDLEWEKVRVRVPLAVDTKAIVDAAIEKTLGDAWRPHFVSANYLFQAGDARRALAFVQKSIAIKPTMRNEWLHAQLLWKAGKKANAKAAANRALKLGASEPGFESFWKGEITKNIASWK